jgi:molecular chaperone Hsp33
LDQLQRALSDDFGLRLIYADATASASEAAGRHLAGPVAARVLSQALVAAALVSSDLDNEGEAISIQWKVNGPIQGILVEAAFGGKLRGYTFRKTLGDLDQSGAADPAEVLGTDGHMTVLHSMPRQLLYSGVVAASPPDVERNLARYFNQSRQTPTAAAMRVELSDGRPARAVGVIAQKLPDSTGEALTERFVEVLERFNDGRVHEALHGSAGVLDVGAALGVADLVVVGTGPLSFACRCSRERVNAVLAMLPRTDLEEMLAETEPQTVVCHFCGETYTVGRDEIARLLEARGKDW